MSLNESIVEEAALEWFGELGYAVGHGPRIAPGEVAAERETFGDVVLAGRLRAAMARLNPGIPEEAREEALRKVLRVGTPSLTQTNRAFHRMLRDGVPVEYPRPDGSIAGDHVRLVDFIFPEGNDWLVVNQFTVIEGQHNRRADIVVFVNGLPLAVLELKNAADEDATIWSACAQLQTYKAEIPSLLAQDHRGLPSVPRGERGGRGNRARQRDGREQRAARGAGRLLERADARRETGRPSRGRGLAHAGQREEFLHAVLCSASSAASGDAEPDAGGAD